MVEFQFTVRFYIAYSPSGQDAGGSRKQIVVMAEDAVDAVIKAKEEVFLELLKTGKKTREWIVHPETVMKRYETLQGEPLHQCSKGAMDEGAPFCPFCGIRLA